ncbi:hypothetical protein PHYBOEH_006135 [Phytophthora boehmeriae]|uniref:Uncharacterized protein n=1 Tax=Phytophthora boehmeriae TaxID=109152 RepID=A0A8T1WIT7_9STRA|nr:hypothetical protein PHYBOEH_006135 [Phytophthora boehmeriae]
MKVGSIERDDGATGITDEPPTTLEQEKQDAIEEEDEAEDVEEPCFNLLGAGGSIFGAPPAEEVEDNAMDEQDCQEEEEEGIEADPSPRFMGFVPASKVLVEEAAIEEKLASAGLDLSDTEDEEDKSPRSLRRHKEEIAAEDEDKFDNPYDDLSQFEYGIPDEPEEPDDRVDVATHVHSNFVEEISDNEPTMSPRNSRPRIQRADLKEFKHFVCMEDLRKDYRCQINYSRMFAGQRSGKSYADRLATRTAESKKRKRNAARKEAGEKGTQPPQHKGKRARAATKKRKTAASTRRASEASKPAKAKRGKKKASPARRASTATPSINHYDTGGDLGEDISTMAWEGVGSAGYF